MTTTPVCEKVEKLQSARPRHLLFILFFSLARVSVSLLVSLSAALVAVPMFASSYYTSRPEDARAVYLTSDNFSVKADGIADDSAALQQAINQVQEKTNQGLLFVPSGRYRISRTIYIWPGIRLIGFGPTRPLFVLAAVIAPSACPASLTRKAPYWGFQANHPSLGWNRSPREAAQIVMNCWKKRHDGERPRCAQVPAG